MTVSVLVPWHPNPNDGREEVWAWVRERLEHFHPDWQIVEGDSPGPLWSKGRALADAASRATGDVLVVHDADCIAHPDILEDAVAAPEPWVVPHSKVHRLRSGDTHRLITQPPADQPPDPGAYDRRPYLGVAGGGVVVLTRQTWDLVGGPDSRFCGWGGEDVCWGLALDMIAGPHRRGTEALWHLWHRPAPLRGRPSEETRRLDRRYKTAGPDDMVQLVAEAKACLEPQPVRTFTCANRKTITVGGHRVGFDPVYETTDGVLAGLLAMHPRVQEVSA